jgi:hypothetical protein
MKYWEIIADNLHKAGWSLGWVSAIDSKGRTIWIADAHRDDGRHFIVRADEKLTAFLELEAAVRRNILILSVAAAGRIECLLCLSARFVGRPTLPICANRGDFITIAHPSRDLGIPE